MAEGAFSLSLVREQAIRPQTIWELKSQMLKKWNLVSLHRGNESFDDLGGPLEPGQAWTISPGGAGENPGLFRIEITEGPGSQVKILNKPVPPAFKESIGFAQQNMYARATQLVGDKEPRAHEFSVQLRSFDAAKTGAKVGLAALLAMSTALLKKSIRGGLIVCGEINLGGSIEPIHNPVSIAEIAVEKGATALLMPVFCRRDLVDLSDDMATKVDIQYYSDARDALLKAITEYPVEAGGDLRRARLPGQPGRGR